MFLKAAIVGNGNFQIKNISGKDGKLYLHGESKETDGQKEKFELKKENGVWYFYENNKWNLCSFNNRWYYYIYK